jgi:hypothetical protein
VGLPTSASSTTFFHCVNNCLSGVKSHREQNPFSVCLAVFKPSFTELGSCIVLTAFAFRTMDNGAKQKMWLNNLLLVMSSGNATQLNDVIELKEKEKLMWEFTENRDEMPVVLEDPEMLEVELFEVESTGARVSTDYSVPLLYRYCSKLPADE